MVCCVKECDLLLSNPAPTLNLFIYLFQTRNSEFVDPSMPLYYFVWFMVIELRYPSDAEMKCLFAVSRCPAGMSDNSPQRQFGPDD